VRLPHSGLGIRNGLRSGPDLLTRLFPRLMATIVFELVALAWIRWRFFAPAFLRSSISVAIGGAISANVSGCARRSQLASPIPNG
jgi:hypothetical protein